MSRQSMNAGQDSASRCHFEPRRRTPRSLVEAAQMRREAEREEQMANARTIAALPNVPEPVQMVDPRALEATIIRLAREGKTCPEISEVVDRHVDSVRRTLQRKRIPFATTPRPPPTSKSRYERVKSLHEEGMVDTEIAAAMGITARQVKHVRQELGLPSNFYVRAK